MPFSINIWNHFKSFYVTVHTSAADASILDMVALLSVAVTNAAKSWSAVLGMSTVYLASPDAWPEETMIMINPLEYIFGIEGQVEQDRNMGPGYNTLLLWLVPGDLYSACPQRQFHKLPDFFDTQLGCTAKKSYL